MGCENLKYYWLISVFRTCGFVVVIMYVYSKSLCLCNFRRRSKIVNYRYSDEDNDDDDFANGSPPKSKLLLNTYSFEENVW